MAQPLQQLATKLNRRILIESLIQVGFRKHSDWQQIFGYTYWQGPVVTGRHLEELMKYLEEVHNKYYSNSTNELFIEDRQQRMEQEREDMIRSLIAKGYEEYWIIRDLPLIIEHYLQFINDEGLGIGDIMLKKMKEDAQFKKIHEDQFIDQIIQFYACTV